MSHGADQIRVTDAEREQAAGMLRVAADSGALSVDEFETRLEAAYVAVVRRDLTVLVADLPAQRAVAPQAAPVEAWTRSSLFWLWCVLPFFTAVSWIHAAIITRASRYWVLAAVYAIPLVIAIVVAPGTDDELPDWVATLAAIFWVVNVVHVAIVRKDVEAARRRTA